MKSILSKHTVVLLTVMSTVLILTSPVQAYQFSNKYGDDRFTGEVIKIDKAKNLLVVFDKYQTDKKRFFVHSNVLSELEVGDTVRVNFKHTFVPISVHKMN